jgi:membrane fusion protein, multidrug efflux system
MHKLSMGGARVCLVAGLVLAIGISPGCKKKNTGEGEVKVPAEVATVIEKDMPNQLQVIGHVEPIQNVSVKALVTGTLLDIHFQEGQEVKVGDKLFTIDPGPFQATLNQAQANLAKDNASLANAAVENKRYQDLFKQDLISHEQWDQVRTNYEVLKASVKADKATVDNAQLNLGYTSISAPIAGRTGSLNFHKGDLIKSNDTTAMVMINQMEPIYITFSVPEGFLDDVKKSMAGGDLRITAAIPGDTSTLEQGTPTFVDNTVDKTTGTIMMKATFPNTDRKLWPGLFANVTVIFSIIPKARVIPNVAIMTNDQGQYVYVVKQDMSVEARPVVTRPVGNDAIAEKGLQPGERVVTDGQLKLAPGLKVELKQEMEKEQGK